VGRGTLDEARTRHRSALAELPRAITMMSAGEPVIPTVHLEPR
jgi:nicotinate phosphoribosyltransferase